MEHLAIFSREMTTKLSLRDQKWPTTTKIPEIDVIKV
jgi:hypothetical protein